MLETPEYSFDLNSTRERSSRSPDTVGHAQRVLCVAAASRFGADDTGPPAEGAGAGVVYREQRATSQPADLTAICAKTIRNA